MPLLPPETGRASRLDSGPESSEDATEQSVATEVSDGVTDERPDVSSSRRPPAGSGDEAPDTPGRSGGSEERGNGRGRNSCVGCTGMANMVPDRDD